MTRERWGFITTHALVLIYVIQHPDSTVREVAAGIGVTERATMAILRELDEEGIIERHRDGRRNTYTVDFPALAAYRRQGLPDRTPAAFVDALVLGLATLAPETPAAGPPPSGHLPRRTGTWGFFTNHLIVLLTIARDRGLTLREVAALAGVTERAVVAILRQLHDAGIVAKSREGRRNTYNIDADAFGAFERWSLGTWRVPAALVEVAVTELRRLGSLPGEPGGLRAAAGVRKDGAPALA